MDSPSSYADVTNIEKNVAMDNKNLELQIMQFIPPLSKNEIRDSNKLQKCFRDCAQVILEQFPCELKDKVTISKTFTKSKDKLLHSITVISPPEAKLTYVTIRTQGLQILGKTVFPIGKMRLNSSPMTFYPKKVNIKFTNLPVICDNVAVKHLLCLPPNITHDTSIKREKENCNGESFFNGKATLSLTVTDSEQETLLRDWSYNARMGECAVWNNVAIRFHIPSLHKCDFCAKHKKLYQGHHVDWCLLAAKQKTVENCTDIATSNSVTSDNTNRLQQENDHSTIVAAPSTLSNATVVIQDATCSMVEQSNVLNEQSAVTTTKPTTMPITVTKEIEIIENKLKETDTNAQDANALINTCSVNTKQIAENNYPPSEESDSSFDESLDTDLLIADSDEQKSSGFQKSSNINHSISEDSFQLVRQKRQFKASNNSPKVLSEIDEKRPKVNKPGKRVRDGKKRMKFHLSRHNDRDAPQD